VLARLKHGRVGVQDRLEDGQAQGGRGAKTPARGVLPLHIRQYLVGVAGERRKDVLARLKQADGAAVRAVRAGRKTGRRARTLEMPV